MEEERPVRVIRDSDAEAVLARIRSLSPGQIGEQVTLDEIWLIRKWLYRKWRKDGFNAATRDACWFPLEADRKLVEKLTAETQKV